MTLVGPQGVLAHTEGLYAPAPHTIQGEKGGNAATPSSGSVLSSPEQETKVYLPRSTSWPSGGCRGDTSRTVVRVPQRRPSSKRLASLTETSRNSELSGSGPTGPNCAVSYIQPTVRLRSQT